MAGLFGMTPEEQRALDMAEGQNLMQAGQQLGGGMLMYAPSMARRQAEGFGDALSAMGIASPQERKKEQITEALQGLDYNDPASMMRAAQKLLALGMTTEAQQLVKAAQDAQTNVASSNLKMAQANKANSYYDLEMFKQQSKNMNETQKLQVKQNLETQKMELNRQIASAKDETERAKLEVTRDLTQAKIDELGTRSALNEAKTVNAVNGVDTNLTETEMFNKWVEEGRQNGVADPFKYALEKRAQYTEAKNPNAGKLSSTVEKALTDSETARTSSRMVGVKASSVADNIEKLKANGAYPSGFQGRLQEGIKSFLGTEDEATYQKIAAQDMLVKNMIANLPAGAASDADMRLVATAQPESITNPDLLVKYLRSLAKLSKINEEYELERSRYLSKGSLAGMADHMDAWYKKKYGDGGQQQTKSEVAGGGRKFLVIAPQGVPDGENTYKGQPVVIIGGKVYAK